MKIPCSSCNQRLEIPEELAGQTIECPACKGCLAVPDLAVDQSETSQVQAIPQKEKSPHISVPKRKDSAKQKSANQQKDKFSFPKWAYVLIAVLAISLYLILIPKEIGKYTLNMEYDGNRYESIELTFNLFSNGTLITSGAIKKKLRKGEKSESAVLNTLYGSGDVDLGRSKGSWKQSNNTTIINAEYLSGRKFDMIIEFNKNTTKLKSVEFMGERVSLAGVKFNKTK
jgi:hypothetical protein